MEGWYQAFPRPNMESHFSTLFVLISAKGFSESELGFGPPYLGLTPMGEHGGTRWLQSWAKCLLSVTQKGKRKYLPGRQTGSRFVFASLSRAVLGSLPTHRAVEVIATLQKTAQIFCTLISLPL